MNLTRRQLMHAAGAGLFGASAMGPLLTRAAAAQPKRILFFTKSAGFEHSPIHRKSPDELSYAETILLNLGKEHGYEVVCSKDGRLFDPDKIGQFDAFVFYTTGDLTTAGADKQPPMSPDGKKAFLDAVAAGKGFIGVHSSTDSFHSQGDQVDPYIKMIGAEFATHGAQQAAKMIVADQAFPGAAGFGAEYTLLDEWYTQRNWADDLHVIIYHDTTNMQGEMYQRPNFPSVWARMQDKGRVVYNSMGHREDVWENTKFQGLLLGSLNWVTGKVDADVAPNVQQVTPHYKQTTR